MIGDGDILRTPETALLPDPRVEVLGRGSLGEHHAVIRAWTLHQGVPSEVREIFETARNLYLYSWFVYRFQPVAWFWSWTAVETALRARAGLVPGERGSLAKLLAEAQSKRWIRAEGFARFRDLQSSSVPPSAEEYLKTVAALARLRNSLGHGSAMAVPWYDHIIEISCDLINQLFEPEAAK